MAAPTLTSANTPATHGIFLSPKTPIELKASRWSLFKLSGTSSPLPPGMYLEEGPGEKAFIVGTPLTAGTYPTIKIECEAMDTTEKSTEVSVEIKVKPAEFQATTSTPAPATLEIAAPDKTGTLVKDTSIKHAGGVRSTSAQLEIEVLLAATIGTSPQLERVN